MKQHMKHRVLGALFALPMMLPLAAHADMGDDHKDGAERHQEMCSDHYAHTAGKLAYLQAKLGITDKQQDAWNRFYGSEIDSAAKERDACLAEKDHGQHPTVLEQEDRLEKMLSNKLDALRASRGPLEDLYKVLSADQKDEFDEFGEEQQHHWHKMGEHDGLGHEGRDHDDRGHDGKPE